MNNFTDQEKKWLQDVHKWYPDVIISVTPDDYGLSNHRYFISLSKSTSQNCYATVTVSEQEFRSFVVQIIRALDFLTDYTMAYRENIAP